MLYLYLYKFKQLCFTIHYDIIIHNKIDIVIHFIIDYLQFITLFEDQLIYHTQSY